MPIATQPRAVKARSERQRLADAENLRKANETISANAADKESYEIEERTGGIPEPPPGLIPEGPTYRLIWHRLITKSKTDPDLAQWLLSLQALKNQAESEAATRQRGAAEIPAYLRDSPPAIAVALERMDSTLADTVKRMTLGQPLSDTEQLIAKWIIGARDGINRLQGERVEALAEALGRGDQATVGIKLCDTSDDIPGFGLSGECSRNRVGSKQPNDISSVGTDVLGDPTSRGKTDNDSVHGSSPDSSPKPTPRSANCQVELKDFSEHDIIGREAQAMARARADGSVTSDIKISITGVVISGGSPESAASGVGGEEKGTPLSAPPSICEEVPSLQPESPSAPPPQKIEEIPEYDTRHRYIWHSEPIAPLLEEVQPIEPEPFETADVAPQAIEYADPYRCLNLRALRSTAKLTLAEVASRVGTSGGRLSMIERGKLRITAERLELIEAAIKTSHV